MSLSIQDAQAIASTAQRLQVDPRTLGALMEMESGLDPNIWGGAGKQYRGLIQFGPGARKEVGLPDGPMSISEQMPYVERYFQQRGFTPGKHGATELYRTVLVGNPKQSGTDSFGTNSDRAAERMKPGGDLYQRFSGKFDSLADKIGTRPSSSGPGAEGARGWSASDGMLSQFMGSSSDDALGELSLGRLKVPGLGDIGTGSTGLPRTAAITSAILPMLAMIDPVNGRMAGEQLQGSLRRAEAGEILTALHGDLARTMMPKTSPASLTELDSGRTEVMPSSGQATQAPSNGQAMPGIKKTAYGDNVQFETPDGARYRLIHGLKDLKTGTYVQGGWGPQGASHYGDHFDIARVDGGFFDRSALDKYAMVGDQPLSAGLTVKGGEFGASRDGGSRVHRAWDYAFGKGARLQLTNGARWLL